MPFANRTQAGKELAKALSKYEDKRVVILALPRGGVPIAREVAIHLHAALDLILVRKIGLPLQPELAMGAVVDGPHPLTVRNEDVIRISGITRAAFDAVRDRELAEIRRRRTAYLHGRPHADLKEKIVIVIDDGIATGATMRAALRAVRQQHPSKLVLAVPVAPTSTIADLSGDADEIICLEQHDEFGAIGMFYADFAQVSDKEVRDALADLLPRVNQL